MNPDPKNSVAFRADTNAIDGPYLVQGSLPSHYREPIDDQGFYLTTGGLSSGSPTLTMYFAHPISAFSFYWGSIDRYNSIAFTPCVLAQANPPNCTAGTPQSFAGNAVCTDPSDPTTCFQVQSDPSKDVLGAVVEFQGTGWCSVSFASTSTAFEFDDIQWTDRAYPSTPSCPTPPSAFQAATAFNTATPEPSSLAALGLGMATLFSLARRKLM